MGWKYPIRKESGMYHKTFFFTLIIFFTLSIISFTNVYAETGQNFDRTQIGPNTFQWSSHYDRILDNGQWVNYKWNDNGIVISFESANLIYKFDKSTCEFALLNPITKQLSINSFAHEVTLNGIKEPLSACSVLNITPSQDSLQINVTRSGISGELKTIYSLDGIGSMEWTHEPVITKTNTTAKLGVIDVCKGCITPTTIQNSLTNQTLYDFGDYTLDTKNEVHGTLKSTISDKGNYIFTYEDKTTKSIGEKLIIDPTFSSNDPTEDAFITTTSTVGVSCSVTASSKDSANAALEILLSASGVNGGCLRVFLEWDISSIPVGSTVTDSSFTYDINLVSNARNCDYNEINTRPSTASIQTAYDDIGDGTTFVNNDATCTTAGDNKVEDLGAAGDADIQAQITSGWWALGIKYDDETRDGLAHFQDFVAEEGVGTPDPTLTITYVGQVGAVTNLHSFQTAGTSVTLEWSAPTVSGGGAAINGYQINYTTPWGNPLTIINANTSNTLTRATVSPLTEQTQYSFRVSALTDQGTKNATGNILNVTTISDFSVGTLNLTTSNIDLVPIKFERNNINDTALFLNVTYSNTFHLACDFHYKFVQTNKTYTNLSNVTVSATRVRSDFQFNGVNNEIIDVFCWNDNAGGMNSTNVNNTNSGRYIITQTEFVLLQQIANFRSGVYGTGGMFGVLDMITLMVVIIGMIGLNRTNEGVGAFFLVALVGAMAFFDIVQWTTFIGSAIALVVMLGVAKLRE